MLRATMMQGLPASGKTEASKIECRQTGAVRVNKDDLRAMLHDSEWSGKSEIQIIRIRDLVIEDCLSHGLSVIVDDTNFHPKHGKRIKELADKYGAEFVIRFIDTDVQTCIKRDSKRVHPVGRKEIMGMYNKYLAPGRLKHEYDPSLPDCIIVDVDGTLADHEGVRGPYEFEKSSNDKPNQEIIDLVRAWWAHNWDQTPMAGHVFIVTGAEDKFREVREAWLHANDVPFDSLFMRQTGDFRADTVIKQEIYYTHIAGRYNVRFVLDDRDRVVVMWREQLGLRVLQVDDGDF